MKIELTKPVITHKDADQLKVLWSDYYTANDEALNLYSMEQLSLKPEYVELIRRLQLKYNYIITNNLDLHYDKLPKDSELNEQLKEYVSQYRKFGIVIPMPGPSELNMTNPVHRLWCTMVNLMRDYQSYNVNIATCPSYYITIYVNSLSLAYELMTVLTNFLFDNEDAPARVQKVRKDLAKVIERLEKLEAKLK